MMQYEALKGIQPDIISRFPCCNDKILRAIGTQQIWEVLRALMAADAYSTKETRVKEFVTCSIRYWLVAVILVNGLPFLYLFSGRTAIRLRPFFEYDYFNHLLVHRFP